jgi:hypothetical protein
MTERWQTELRKLRDVVPPADLEARIAEGPRPEPPPSGTRRVVAAVTAFALFAAAGVFAFAVLRDDGTRVGGGGQEARLVLELAATDQKPTATLRFGDEVVDVVTEGYEWCDETGNQCSGMIADFTFYPPVSEFVLVPPGTPIEVTGDGTVERLTVTDPADERIPGANDLVVPDADGRYVFGFTGVFSQGEGSFFFGVQALTDPASAPDVIAIDCLTGQTDTSIVQTQADGLHIVATNTDGFRVYVVTPAGTAPDDFVGVSVEPSDGSQGHPFPPGRWELECSEGEVSVEPGYLTPAFELVDPADHWAPTELACTDAPESSFATEIPVSTPHADAATQVLGGLQAGDRVRGAGYGAETWKVGPSYVVDRGGRAVARLVLSIATDVYGGTLTACADSGIALASPPVLPPVDAGTPDVVILRCEGLGPAIDTPTVRLQSDGLHIEATNVADATVISIEPQADIQEPVLVDVDSVTENIVLDVPPGTYWVGCRVPNEEGVVEGGHEEVPDAYGEVVVLPAEG